MLLFPTEFGRRFGFMYIYTAPVRGSKMFLCIKTPNRYAPQNSSHKISVDLNLKTSRGVPSGHLQHNTNPTWLGVRFGYTFLQYHTRICFVSVRLLNYHHCIPDKRLDVKLGSSRKWFQQIKTGTVIVNEGSLWQIGITLKYLPEQKIRQTRRHNKIFKWVRIVKNKGWNLFLLL